MIKCVEKIYYIIDEIVKHGIKNRKKKRKKKQVDDE